MWAVEPMSTRYWHHRSGYEVIKLYLLPLGGFGISAILTEIYASRNEFGGCSLVPIVTLLSAGLMFGLGFFDQRFKFHIVVALACATACTGGLWLVAGSATAGVVLIYGVHVLVTWLVSLGGSALGIRASRRRYTIAIRGRQGVCPFCGYPLRGLPERRCPECGRPFSLEEVGMTEDELRDVRAQDESDDSEGEAQAVPRRPQRADRVALLHRHVQHRHGEHGDGPLVCVSITEAEYTPKSCSLDCRS